jgi:hypothetical protein
MAKAVAEMAAVSSLLRLTRLGTNPMQILTPSGYKNIADCVVGDEVSAFDIATGAPIVNTIESLQWVDATEWARWWQVEQIGPPFQSDSLGCPGVPNRPIKAEQSDYDGKQSHERPSPTCSDRADDNPNAKGDYSCRD